MGGGWSDPQVCWGGRWQRRLGEGLGAAEAWGVWRAGLGTQVGAEMETWAWRGGIWGSNRGWVGRACGVVEGRASHGGAGWEGWDRTLPNHHPKVGMGGAKGVSSKWERAAGA